MRIVRGAGSPHELAHQIAELVDAYRAYFAAFDRAPAAHEVQQALKIDQKGRFDEMKESSIATITSGALRFAAGRLLHQDLQASHGENEMTKGMYRWEALREERHRERQAEHATQRSGKKKRIERPIKL
jgi:hypothetical protein